MTSPFPRRNVLVYTSDRDLRSRVMALGTRVKGAGAPQIPHSVVPAKAGIHPRRGECP